MFDAEHALRNTPIKRKLTIITMWATAAALLLAFGIVSQQELVSIHNGVAADLEITAAIVGENTASALVFGDAEAAARTLGSLQKNKHVIGATVYDREGREFSTYRRTGAEDLRAPPLQRTNTHSMGGDGIKLFQPIEVGGETAGWIFIQNDLDQVIERHTELAVACGAAAIAGFLLSYWLVRRMQVAVSGPISNLSNAAKRVTTEKDYSIRAAKHGDDELGQLIDGFNEMLDQIQQRDAALREASTSLEKRVAERTKELAHSVAVLNATLESTADGILAVHFGDTEPLCNSQYTTMWRTPPHLLTEHFNAPQRIEWAVSQAKDPDQLRALVARVTTHPEAETFDVIELKDGRTFERYVKPEKLDGKVIGVVINYRDVTARKQAERELDAVHKQLVESSRRAGMAEIAAGVLHNVGNVLNSVNVSASLIGDSVRNSKITSLAKLVELLEQRKNDLAAFVTTDPQGRHLPEFLKQLSRHLREEREKILAETEALCVNIDHVKQIVAMQQAYSKTSGLREMVDAADLIRTALRINEVSLQRHGITVVEDLAAMPAINTEKHKVLQILVNLIRNAKLACQESGRDDKHITLRAAMDSAWLRISILDNGTGIAAENLTRIFNHGFTTRKDGHGFGLHSGALAARELGGSLRASSDGVGNGACFTLELPLREPELVDA